MIDELEDWRDYIARMPSKPISPTATARNRRRWQALLNAGWKSIGRRAGTGTWVHPDHPGSFHSTAAAVARNQGRWSE